MHTYSSACPAGEHCSRSFWGAVCGCGKRERSPTRTKTPKGFPPRFPFGSGYPPRVPKPYSMGMSGEAIALSIIWSSQPKIRRDTCLCVCGRGLKCLFLVMRRRRFTRKWLQRPRRKFDRKRQALARRSRRDACRLRCAIGRVPDLLSTRPKDN